MGGASRLRRVAASLLGALILVACGGGGGGGAGGIQYPTSTLKGNVSLQVLSATIGNSYGPLPKYGVNAYKISYQTTSPAGATVTASGLLLVPQKTGVTSSPVLSLQHGTLTVQSLAPSNVNINAPATIPGDVVAGFAAASFGYVVVMPDYLGYGDGQSVFHPYVQATSLATSTVDMIRASQRILANLGVATSQQLFLAGYSEGGYATLATQKHIETSLGSEFTITASEPGSGPYDISGTVTAALNTTNLSGVTRPSYLAFVLEAYHAHYDSSTLRSTYFTPSALSCANTYFVGGLYGANTTGGSFDACVNSTVTADVLNAAFLAAFANNDASVATLKLAFASNDLYNWKPQVPTRLYYSPLDEMVPAANTTTAYNTMTGLGSSTVVTAACPLSGITTYHGSCSTTYFIDMFSFFGQYATNL